MPSCPDLWWGDTVLARVSNDGVWFVVFLQLWPLVIGGTLFKQKGCHNGSSVWTDCQRTGNQIDNITICDSFRNCLLDMCNKKRWSVSKESSSNDRLSSLVCCICHFFHSWGVTKSTFTTSMIQLSFTLHELFEFFYSPIIVSSLV